MNRYNLEPCFDPKTGVSAKPEQVLIGWYCDFCGKFLPWEDYTPDTTLTINEISESEESYYYHELPAYPNINIHSIFEKNQNYIYCVDYDREESCSADMARVGLDQINRHKGHGFSLESFMQEARLTVVGMLLAQGIPPEELGLKTK